MIKLRLFCCSFHAKIVYRYSVWQIAGGKCCVSKQMDHICEVFTCLVAKELKLKPDCNPYIQMESECDGSQAGLFAWPMTKHVHTSSLWASSRRYLTAPLELGGNHRNKVEEG